MELVYLWVEEYKNIKNQGFNFSPRFEFEYIQDKNELILKKENKDYVSIFPKNINITAIVGENGSGKSSVLNYLIQIIYKINEKKQKKYIFIYSKNSEIFYQSNIEQIDTEITKSSNDLETVVYTILFDFSLGDGDVYNQKDTNKYKVNYSIEPSRNYYTESMGGISKIENQSYNANMYANAIYFYKHTDKDIIKHLKLPNFNTLRYKTETGIGSINKENALKTINIIKNPNLSFEQLQKQIKDITFNSFFDDLYSDIQDEILVLFKLKFTNDDGLEFSSLSKGQQQIISYLGILAKLKKRFETREYLNIFFDEVESTLHPNWQRNFINLVIKFIQKSDFFKDTVKINLIFATHSPFILSDFPKENVIFLEKYKKDEDKNQKEGNCKIVTPNINQTFGANIHTLLSHCFFMEDGLMGEFAKSKITEIIEILKKEQLSEDEIKTCKHIISIIGEPILQKTLEHQLSGKVNPNETEIQKLEREQKEIQEKIDKLTGKNNEKD